MTQPVSRVIVGHAFALALLASGCNGCDKKDPSSTTETKASTSAAASASATPIPSTPLAGKVGGEPFTLKKISMLTAKGFGEWRVSIEGSTPAAETAAVRMPVRTALGEGKSYESGATPLTPGATKIPGVSIQAGPKNTTSTNATVRVEITKWDVKPCPADSDPVHSGGLASGKILVQVPGENTEISGTFTDATVSYGATPDWTYR